MKNDKPRILLETEGSYPYSGGGVSTWAHILCTELVEKVDFDLLAVTGNPYVESRYRLPQNVHKIIHIPLWGVDEPSDYYDNDRPFSYQIKKKARTTKEVTKNLFKPIFEDFLACLFDPYSNVQHISEVLYGMWKYFDYFDYKQTMRQPLLWFDFKYSLQDYFDVLGMDDHEQPRVFDMTFGMRWFYHFLMPIAAPIPPKVDVTHATIAGFPALASIASKFEYGIPSIVTDHGVYMRERLINVGQADMPFFSKKLLVDLSTIVSRAVYHTADQISPVTTANTDWEKRFEAKEEHILPIYNGVNTDVFVPTPKPSKTKDTPTVVAVAHLFPLKDIETMIETAALVREEIPEVQFTVYGSLEVDKDYVKKCRKLIKERKLEDTFHLGGYHDQPSMIFNEGDISILTSISEGFPYTVIESMSCARPVVATDVGGIRDALEGCGILCKPRDPRDIANGVLKLLKDDDLRLEYGRKARERVLLTFKTEKSVNAYYDSYKELARKERKPLKNQVETASVKYLLEYLYDKEDAYHEK
ncbi:GT4 family glycosyltransferase PelF [Gracilimonas mengyeensis]|uniref:Glycosyltransferase involved in cell wall bisynthesis n=1 Tax=Gracilimonas mengyeensis TaxID=1302730 RepID=A0A521AIM1_9BACT|nr:GT4 family glycosyltransferase PelF [Gracilimonas mengyeensis]SMO34540.1 Glycosyltransferase involved in cell wall bisynthesis [Gracilimonas mengyeensis]